MCGTIDNDRLLFSILCVLNVFVVIRSSVPETCGFRDADHGNVFSKVVNLNEKHVY